ncbi:MAG: hypothetical protein JNK85_09855 [Verrucomicrobiales bacterium]|nr:hypothetical protein [Verrucomicrobiales bacterium]
MSVHGLVLLGILFSSFVTGVAIFFLKEENHRTRTWLNLLGAGLKLILVAALLWGTYRGQTYSLTLEFLPGIDFALGADSNSVLFVTLSTVLWFWTTLYAVGYLEHSPNRSRFFGFFSLCVTATTGIALSANLVTFLTFFELLTVSTYPLVVHRGTKDALGGGRIYLGYTLAGGALLLLAVAWLHSLAGPVAFKARGVIQSLAAGHRVELQVIFVLFMLGLGVKAAILPLHGWLPKAMVAPAPVSALLHAVAVVKAGAFGIVRVVYDVYGVETASELNVLQPLALAAGATIVYGSIRALFQDELKKRLAYSTVSQVSYIVLGVAILSPVASIGGLVHLVHQGLMKITLFFGAGNYAEALGIHKVSEMNGVGRRMPLTTSAFTIGALGMMGTPFLAGAVSKHYLKLGAEESGDTWAVWILTVSGLLNAAYFIPILWRAWFKPPSDPHPAPGSAKRTEPPWALVVPPVVTALMVIWAGLFAEQPFSPLAWVKLVAQREFGH